MGKVHAGQCFWHNIGAQVMLHSTVNFDLHVNEIKVCSLCRLQQLLLSMLTGVLPE